MLNSSIWLINRTLSSATTPSQRGLVNDGNKEVLRISQSSSINGDSPSDCLMSYPGPSLGAGITLCRDEVGVFYNPSLLGNSLGELYFSAGMKLMYSTAPARQSKIADAIIDWILSWKSNLTAKTKRSFFQAAVVSVLLYRCTTWALTKRLEKKLDGNYTRMLIACNVIKEVKVWA